MEKALIYTTGLTKANMPIAKYIANKAKSDIFNLKELSRLNLDAYDMIIFGSACKGGNPDKLVQEFVDGNKDVIAKKKKVVLYVLTDKDDDKSKEQAASVSKALGISEYYCIPKKSENMNDSGFASAADDFIAEL